jgi:HSP20 family protein
MEFVLRSRLGSFAPNADVFIDEEGSRIVVVIEVAGADPETLRVAVDERHLVVAGRRQESARVRCGSFIQKEIVHGEFVKRIALPVPIEYEGVSASYGDGLLTIVAPIGSTAYMPTARTQLRIMVKRTNS